MEKLTGKQKVALVLLNIDRKIASEALKVFSKDEITVLWQEIKAIEKMKLATEDVEAFLSDYLQYTKTEGMFNNSSSFFNVLKESLGETEAKQVVARIKNKNNPPFSLLSKMDSSSLSALLHVEHPQTTTLILAHLNSEKAADVLSSFPREKQIDIIKRFLAMRQPSEDILREMDKVVSIRASSLSQGTILQKSLDERSKDMADILYLLGDQSKEVLEDLSEDDPVSAEKIRDLMMVFSDLINVSKKEIPLILSQVETKVIATSLKGVSEDIGAHLLSGLSNRVRTIVEEEKELLGPIPQKEAFEAQKAILKAARQLAEEGKIRLSKSGGASELVE